MGWTAKMRGERFSKAFSKNGNYRRGRANSISTRPENNRVDSEDTQNRHNIFEEIKTRCSQ